MRISALNGSDMEAVLAASIFEAASEDLRETRRCWLPGALPTPPRNSTT
jgi:hypothetical protein